MLRARFEFVTTIVETRWRAGPFYPYPAKLNSSIFHPLEVVSRHRDPQLQMAENY